VALDVLEALAARGLDAHLLRTARSGVRPARLRIGPDGRSTIDEPADGTGAARFVWELYAGRAVGDDEQLPRLHDVIDEVPPDVDDLLERSVHAADAFVDAEELVDALRSATDGAAATHEDVALALDLAPPPVVLVAPTVHDVAPSTKAPPTPVTWAPDPPSAPRAEVAAAAPPVTAPDELASIDSSEIVFSAISSSAPTAAPIVAPSSLAESPRAPAASGLITAPPPPPAAALARPNGSGAATSQAPAPRETIAPDTSASPQTLAPTPHRGVPAVGKRSIEVHVPVVEASSTLVLLVCPGAEGERLEAALRDADHEVLRCDDAARGFEMAVDLRPACVVLDFDLPDIAGDQLAARLRRADGPLALTPLLLMARPADTRARVARYAVGADVCVLKPYKVPDVVAQTSALVRFAARLRATRAVLPQIEEPRRTELAGDLARVPLRALLTLVEMERRSGLLELVHGPDVARLGVLTGRLLSGTVNDEELPPLELLRRIAGWTRGRFTLTSRPHAAPPKDALVISEAIGEIDAEEEARAAAAPPPEVRRVRAWTGVRQMSLTPWSAARDESAPPARTVAAGGAPMSVAEASPVDLVDLTLLAWLATGEALLTIEPSDAGSYAVGFGDDAAPAPLDAVPLALGEAMIARLVLLAGLDIGHPEEQLGRLRVSDGVLAAASEVLVIARSTPYGMAAEVKRVQSPRDSRSSSPSLLGGTLSSAETPYRVLRTLGEGAAGTVYLVEHAKLGRQAALKVLHPEVAAIAEVGARFLREGRAASRVRHPGVIDVFDYGVYSDGRPFLVMEYVEGETLEHAIDHGPPLSPLRAVRIARQIASVLDAVHAAGIVHRDVKPSNVLIAPGDVVKLGDFGVAKVPDHDTAKMTNAGALIGTPTYMAPEHMTGEPLDHRTDIYALGCVLYEMLAGRVAYSAETVFAILVLHVTAPIPEVTSPSGPLPPVLEATVRRAMAKRPKDRYEHARDMLHDLDEALAELTDGPRSSATGKAS
jgi:serine/threonine-protein kinase